MTKNILTLMVEDHKVKPICVHNKTGFAYELTNVNGYKYKGLWILERFDSEIMSFIYSRYN